MQITYENLSKYYFYCHERKAVVRIKNNQTLSYDESLMSSLYDPKEKVKNRVKYNKICWILGNKRDFPEGKRILHINMNEKDFRLNNLRIVDTSDYNLAQEAIRNLAGALRMEVHPSDMFSFHIKYIKQGKHITETISDVVPAKRRFIALQLRYAKILSKFCNIEN